MKKPSIEVLKQPRNYFISTKLPKKSTIFAIMLSIKMTNNTLLYLTCILFFTSCASYGYENTDSNKNRKVQIISKNQQSFTVHSAVTSEVLGVTNEGHLNLFLPKLRRKYSRIKLINPNCDTVFTSIKKTPRSTAFFKDFCLSAFTFGVPLMVDIFRSDFYKVSKKSQLLNVEFVYTQNYMREQFELIKNSDNPLVFTRWMDNFPNANIFNLVVDHKDSLELEISIAKQNELAIDDFINKHPNSKYLKTAIDLKSEMVASNKLYKEAMSTNTVEAYESFIQKFPRSLQNVDAHVNLVAAAEKRALNSGKSISMLNYLKFYLLPNRTFLQNSTFAAKCSTISVFIDNQIITENIKTDTKNFYESYSSLWKTYIAIKNEPAASVLKKFEKTISYHPRICDMLFTRLKDRNTEIGQSEFIKEINRDFPNLELYNNPRNVIITILENATNKTGQIKLFDIGYLPYYFDNLPEGNPLIGRRNFNYQGEELIAMKSIDMEEISFQNNYLFGTSQCYFLQNLEFALKMGSRRPIEISYFSDGVLLETTFFNDNYTEYTYEYKNGVNLTFNQLKSLENDGNEQLKLGNYDEAISIFTSALNNNYPGSIPVKLSLSKGLSDAALKKKQYLAKIEAERIREEKRLLAIQIAEEKAQIREQQRIRARFAEEERQEAIEQQNILAQGVICDWCGNRYHNYGFYHSPSMDRIDQSDGRIISPYKRGIFSGGYKFFCSRKCGSEYLWNK